MTFIPLSQFSSGTASIESLFSELLRRCRQSSASPFVVAITGPDCAGKSTLTAAFGARLTASGADVCIVSIDDYLVPRVERGGRPSEGWSYYERGFDYRELRSRVHCEIRGAMTNRSSSTHVILVEGVFLLRRDLSDLWDYSIWIEIDEETSIRRAMERDKEIFGSEEAVRKVYLERCLPGQRWHSEVDSPRERVDATLDGECLRMNTDRLL